LDLFDLIVLVVVLLGAWRGYQQGLFREVMRLFGVVLAYAVALWLEPYLAPVVASTHWFPTPQHAVLGHFLGDLHGAIAFVLTFVVVYIVLRYLIGVIDAVFRLPVLSTINRLAGMVAGILLALVVMYVLTLVLHYVDNPRIQQELTHSAIANWFEARHFATPNQNPVGAA
jgi:uncharacterized membrane protein required for colicin V production